MIEMDVRSSIWGICYVTSAKRLRDMIDLEPLLIYCLLKDICRTEAKLFEEFINGRS